MTERMNLFKMYATLHAPHNISLGLECNNLCKFRALFLVNSQHTESRLHSTPRGFNQYSTCGLQSTISCNQCTCMRLILGKFLVKHRFFFNALHKYRQVYISMCSSLVFIFKFKCYVHSV